MSFLKTAVSETANVKVAVRVRPFNKRETKTSSVVSVKKCNIAITDINKNKSETHSYDYAYDVNTDQSIIYEQIGKEIVNNAFNGYNTCIFAYGQTGSGKTHTIMGNPSEPGLVPRICQALFDNQASHNGIDIKNATVSYKIEMSYLEIYSEEVRDLLSRTPTSKLKVREHPEFGPYVEGLSQILTNDFSTIEQLIEQGNRERTTAVTLMNDQSSRSHAILTIYFTQLIDEPELGKTREIVSKINLVDLAGSERVELSGVTGTNFKEAIQINKSLSVLTVVINKLAERQKTKIVPRGKHTTSLSSHVPYRDSVLTFILRESLGGNSKTFMIAAISPSSLCYSESISTLRYASSAKKIKNNVKVNEDPSDKLIKVLRDEITILKKQLELKGDDTRLKEEIALREELMREKDKTWEQKLEEAKKVSEQIKEQIKEQVKKEYMLKIEESKAINDAISKENERLLAKLSSQELADQKMRAEELLERQKELNKDNLIEAVMVMQKYFDDKLLKIQENYEEKNTNATTSKDVEDLRNLNNSLKEELEKTKLEMRSQIRQFTEDRIRLGKQIEQLHNKIKKLDQSKTYTSDDDKHVYSNDIQNGNLDSNQNNYLNELTEKIKKLETLLSEKITNAKEKLKNPSLQDFISIQTDFQELFDSI